MGQTLDKIVDSSLTATKYAAALVAKVSASLGVGGVLVGDGQTYLEKVVDGVYAMPDIIGYIPNMYNNYQTIVNIADGADTLEQGIRPALMASIGKSSQEIDNQILVQSAKEGSQGAIDTVTSTSKNLWTNTKSSVENTVEVVKATYESDKTWYEKLIDLPSAIHTTVKESWSKDITEGQYIDQVVQAASDASATVKVFPETMSFIYNNLEEALVPLQAGSAKLYRIIESINFNDIYASMDQIINNFDKFPILTVAATASVYYGMHMVKNGWLISARKGPDGYFDDKVWKLGRKVFKGYFKKEREKNPEMDLEQAKFSDVLKAGTYGLMCLGIDIGKWALSLGVLLGDRKTFSGKLQDAFELSYLNVNQMYQNAGNGINNLGEIFKSIAYTKNLGVQEISTKITEAKNLIDQNQALSNTYLLSENLTEQIAYTAAALGLIHGGAFLIKSGVNFWTSRGEGFALKKFLRRTSSKIWPDEWKKKLKQVNGS